METEYRHQFCSLRAADKSASTLRLFGLQSQLLNLADRRTGKISLIGVNLFVINNTDIIIRGSAVWRGGGGGDEGGRQYPRRLVQGITPLTHRSSSIIGRVRSFYKLTLPSSLILFT